MPASRKSTRKSARKSTRKSTRKNLRNRPPSTKDRQLARDKIASGDVLKVRLSGGPTRLHFEGFSSKEKLQEYLARKYPKLTFEFTHRKDADFIVIPNGAKRASDSALGESKSKVYCLADFQKMLRPSI